MSSCEVRKAGPASPGTLEKIGLDLPNNVSSVSVIKNVLGAKSLYFVPPALQKKNLMKAKR